MRTLRTTGDAWADPVQTLRGDVFRRDGMDLKLWLKERELNARQIASRKTISDRSLWIEDANYFKAAYDAIQRAELQEQKPIDMVLHCPACGLQHVDAPSPTDGQNLRLWSNPPHRSHLCRPEDGGCGHIWRPADVPTNGVAAVKTKGKADSPVDQAPNAQQAEAQEPCAWRHSKTFCLYETEEAVPLADGDEWAEPLFTRPQPAQLQALSEEEAITAWRGVKDVGDDKYNAILLGEAIQSALAAKNGAVLAVIKAKESK